MNVLLFTGYYLPGYKGGGPIKTIANLIGATSDVINYKVVTSDRDLGDNKPYSDLTIAQWNPIETNMVFYADKGFAGLKQIANAVFKKDYDVIYLNSFFSVRFSLIPLLSAKLTGKPIILAPRGEFSAGALSIKVLKKKVFIGLYKLLNLNRNVLFQTSSDFESKDVRRALGKHSTVFVAENIGSQEYSEEISHKKSDTLKLVFISRISPKKNLAYALNLLADLTCPIVFDIYGPREDMRYWQECEHAIKKLPEHVNVHYKGLLKPSEVVTALSAYDLFLMPTKGENYGHVIAEALCAGLPILIANTTPWRDLSAKSIGWDISLDKPELFVQAIEEASAISAEDYQELRNNVLSWAKQKFDQRDAIDANIAMFRYAIDKE